MGDGTKENPYTREDVLKLIEENGDTAKGLDLSDKVFEEEIDLRGINNNNLQGIILENAIFPPNLNKSKKDRPLRGANLKGMHLEGAHLRSAHLEEAHLSDTYLNGANLGHAILEEVDLSGAHFGDAYLGHAHLQGAILLNAEFSPDTGLEDIDWGNFILGDEEKLGPDMAVGTYRRLKIWYTEHGIYNVAGRFYFREREAKRKSLSWETQKKLKIWNWILMRLCGYGESWMNVVVSAFFLFLFFTLVYFFVNHVWTLSTFGRSLYFSAVSFTALGYGSWTNTWFTSNVDWIRGLGAAESFLGVFMMALFLVTFTRKMTR